MQILPSCLIPNSQDDVTEWGVGKQCTQPALRSYMDSNTPLAETAAHSCSFLWGMAPNCPSHSQWRESLLRLHARIACRQWLSDMEIQNLSPLASRAVHSMMWSIPHLHKSNYVPWNHIIVQLFPLSHPVSLTLSAGFFSLKTMILVNYM